MEFLGSKPQTPENPRANVHFEPISFGGLTWAETRWVKLQEIEGNATCIVGKVRGVQEGGPEDPFALMFICEGVDGTRFKGWVAKRQSNRKPETTFRRM